MECAHENGCASDNRLVNLSWKTRSENALDKAKHGTLIVGERNNKAKLTSDKVRRIRRLRGYLTVAAIAEHFGISKDSVWLIWSKAIWKHVRD
jgi:hypothetical protein